MLHDSRYYLVNAPNILAHFKLQRSSFVGSTKFKRLIGRIWRHKDLQKPTLCAAKLSAVLDFFKRRSTHFQNAIKVIKPFSKSGRLILKRRPYNFQKVAMVDPSSKDGQTILKRRFIHCQGTIVKRRPIDFQKCDNIIYKRWSTFQRIIFKSRPSDPF